jgi:hypothetical protein
MPITATPGAPVVAHGCVLHCPGDQAPAASAATCSPDPIDDQESQFKHQPGRLVHTNHDSARGSLLGNILRFARF